MHRVWAYMIHHVLCFMSTRITVIDLYVGVYKVSRLGHALISESHPRIQQLEQQLATIIIVLSVARFQVQFWWLTLLVRVSL